MTFVTERGKGPWLSALVLAGALATACGDYREIHPQSVQPPGRVALTRGWAYVEPDTGTVFFVSVEAGAPKARVGEVGRFAVKTERRHGPLDHLLVLTQGVVGARGVEEEAPALWVMPAAAEAPPVKVPLDARYDQFAQSPDGRFVVMFFGAMNPGGSAVAFNPNQLAVVDLAEATPVASPRLVPSLGGVPTGIDFSPALVLPDGARSLVLVRSRNYVTLMDLGQPLRTPITIPLTLSDDPRVLLPAQVLFDPMGPFVFVRVVGGSDIFSIRLMPLAPTERQPGGHDFRPVLSQLAAGRAPRDMALFDAGQGLRLMVAGADPDVTVVDPVSSRSLKVPLEHDVGSIVTWAGASPGNVMPTAQALLVSSSMPKATFVDLVSLETLKTRNLEVVNLAAPASDVVPNTPLLRVVLRHAGSGLTVLDLAARQVLPIGSGSGIFAVRSGPALPNLLWLLSTSDRLGFLNLSAGQLAVGEVRLDAPVDDVMVTLDTDGTPRVLVSHPHPLGHVTALDAAAPSRATARSLEGFWAQDLLSRTERNVR
ncbi:MAG: hypothetical protein KA712_06160 [Myxococcales bacterium]|nr:hypothetical protein [Myxococcales bacterium]